MSADDLRRKVALKIEDELIARIKRGDPIPDIRKWFCNRFFNEDAQGMMFDDLTPFGQAFANQMVFQFNEWQKWQEELARTGKRN
jgi:hypothetical protein